MVGDNNNKGLSNLQTKQIKDIVSGVMGDKMGLGADRMKALGGFMELFDEGSKIYDSKKESILNTGKLLESIVGDQGLVTRLAGISESTFDFFGRIDEGVAATNSLVEGLRSFIMTQETNQAELVQQAALFKALGVQMSDFNAVIDSARLGFDMSSQAAAQLSREVANIGNATGVGMKEAMSNFSRAQSSMAYDSDKLMQNFRALQLTSAQTGVGFEKLTGAFGESMDTFEGSAGKAGTLNAILGRSVFNSIDLLGKTEAQRVETIIQGIKKNVNMEALGKNKFQLKAISKGLGLSPDETKRLLLGQMTVDEALAQKTEKDPRAKATKRMAELLGETNVGLNEFSNMLNRMRTSQSNATVSFNAMMRGLARSGLASAGLTIENPTAIFEQIQSALREVARGGSMEDVNQRAKELSNILSGEGAIFDPNSDMSMANRKEGAKALFKKLGEKVREITASLPETPDFAGTDEAKARKGRLVSAASLDSSQEVLFAKAIGLISEPLSKIAKTISPSLQRSDGLSVLDGAKLVLQVGEKEIAAVIRSVIKSVKVGDPTKP